MKRIKFIDVSRPVLECEDRFLFDMISSVADVVIDETSPECVIDLGYGHEYLDPRYEDCIKIAISSESLIPDFSWFDYVVGFDYIDFGDRYLRYPFFARWKGFKELCSWSPCYDDRALLDRDFCSFIVSNTHCTDPFREVFFKRLSQYKPVASGGRLLNNVGGPVPDKREFCAKFKFNIAFENSVSPGYVTEKIVEPLSVNSVPIYYGHPFVERDFDPGCMVLISSHRQMEETIERIVELDKDDDAYLKLCRAKRFANADFDRYNRELKEFFARIFCQSVQEARRAPTYGYGQVVRAEMRQMYADERLVRGIKGKFRKLLGK